MKFFKIFWKVVIAVIVVGYIFSPIDLVPGPIDDVIVALIGSVVELRLKT